MIVVGLTGGVGMGKSTAARMLRRLRVPVHDSDATVHALLSRRGGAVTAVARAFPEALRDGAIDRKTLGRRVFGDDAALKRLEAILHPLVRQDTDRFLKTMRARHAPLIVLDIPLLFETGGERRCDAVVAMTAPAYLQCRRVMARPGMTHATLAAILARQLPDHHRRRRADFVVPSGLGLAITFARLRRIIEGLRRGES